MNSISIIIPILNENECIGPLLKHLLANSSPSNIAEITVVDGGSTDGSQAIVKAINGITLRTSEKGRAKQMNLGAKQAKGSILYFLHADAFPPKDFDTYIIDEVEKENFAGCFRMQFDSSHWWLKLASWLTQFNWRPCRGGDQSQFITKALFEEIGGYNENYIIYEDNILINELYKRKAFVVINKKIKTSARLYKKVGVWKLQYHFWTIYVKRWFGANADELLAYYKKYIAS
ncbi:TIGR04283 family arsenosugar biosynthesis glycosyltransferase [Winogradskyella sp. DF17]|uniref:TIGR04283 family arsenosugar biosynthesis glycosyltransferase n=1 Tax=Winogradskyella pelagia TaxID=2819984 RepID=A0ABS3SYY5_9FLAO|nr:TIGR04283 family arsenosugar biosynthesis glycosyltransferase [Winogradskyella sp. DF17]MBO3115701.1 TIGR04283 family arsenosugar biosynthesis glycosyltransferase [Winogradskyella sp. DF17]